LQRQADELAPDSLVLLDRVGLRPGDSAIDLGCGPRGIIDLLSERVSPGGRVVGFDADPAHVAMASELAATRALGNVEIVCADARHTGLESCSFDLVHTGTLLVTLPEPAEVLAEMVRLARPGGQVAGLEPDTEAAISYPPHPAFERLCEIFTVAFSRNGADPHFRRRMAELYRQAGLEDVTVEVRAGVYPAGHSRRTIRADLVRSMRPQILDMGLADESELDELDAAARKHFDDPHTVVMPGLMSLAWGRKPASALATQTLRTLGLTSRRVTKAELRPYTAASLLVAVVVGKSRGSGSHYLRSGEFTH
jgi:ubiquinone/menaquinone biosynthesis C-methylase UbiE